MSRYRDIIKFRKSFDLVTNWVHYPIAGFLCTLLSFTSITPNQITFLAVLSEIGAVYFILTDFESTRIWIVALLQLGWILDLMDGMMARYRKIGYYHPTNPTLQGAYFDAVSDHVKKFVIIGSLSYQLSFIHQFGWQIGMMALIMQGITQTEHTLRNMLIKSNNISLINGHTKENIIGNIALLMNNIYLFYLVFIPINRIDLLLMGFTIANFILFFKRVIVFWLYER